MEKSVPQYHGGQRAEDGSAEQPLAIAGGEAFEKCFQHLYENFDAANGGFGGARRGQRALRVTPWV